MMGCGHLVDKEELCLRNDTDFQADAGMNKRQVLAQNTEEKEE